MPHTSLPQTLQAESGRIATLPPYVFQSVARWRDAARAQGVDVVDFSMGNPDQPTPPHIVEKLIEAVQRGDTHRYSQSRGIPRLRQAIVNWYALRYAVTLDPDQEAIVTIGSKEGLAHLALATLEPGDSVLVPDPAYPIHQHGIDIAGATAVPYVVSAEVSPVDAITGALARAPSRPKLLLLNYPSNPTGVCIQRDQFEQILALAEAHDLWVINDLAYADIVFDGYQAPSILQIPGASRRAVEFFSLSKSYNMPGWRVGFMAGNRELVAALAKLKSYFDYGTFTPIQVAAIAALEGPQDCVAQTRALYQERRNLLCKGLNRIGWPVEKPRGTMFVWAKIPSAFAHLDPMQFTQMLIEQAGVAVSPGIGFGAGGEGYVRFGLIENNQRIRQAVRALKQLFPVE